jgi:hypothetical protein
MTFGIFSSELPSWITFVYIQIQKGVRNEKDRIFIHGMVMAFNMKSMIRDWLKQGPDLEGKKITLLVTANRWTLDALTRDLTKLLKKDKATVVEAVSMATKSMDSSAKEKAIGEMVGHLK